MNPTEVDAVVELATQSLTRERDEARELLRLYREAGTVALLALNGPDCVGVMKREATRLLLELAQR